MRRLLVSMCVFFLGFAAVGSSFASRPVETGPLPAGDVLELVVFEVDGCKYCEVFRRDVLPAYLLSPRSSEVPIRFIDLSDGVGRLSLDTPVEIVPTVVLVNNNRETGRISGYSGVENFFQSMRYLLTRAE